MTAPFWLDGRGWQALGPIGTRVGLLPSWRGRLVRGEGEGQAPCRTAAAAETLVCSYTRSSVALNLGTGLQSLAVLLQFAD